MDGLEEFEKALAIEKADREREERRLSKYRHHRQRHHHHRHDDSDKERESRRPQNDNYGHRHKRSRHIREDESNNGHREHLGRPHHSRDPYRGDSHHMRSSLKGDLPQPGEESLTRPDIVEKTVPKKFEALVRDAWMTAPSALDVERVHRPDRNQSKPPTEELKRVTHKREINTALQAPSGTDTVTSLAPKEAVGYTFGDEGSSWRMTKLKAVYNIAEETCRSVDDVALERYGTLEAFDDAREERDELERRQIYGDGYEQRDKPKREFYHRQRQLESHSAKRKSVLEQGVILLEEEPRPIATDQTTLNRRRAQMMKAKLRRAPDAAQLEEEYKRAAAAAQVSGPSGPTAVVLGVMESRLLAGTRGEVKAINMRRGRERSAVEENEDMSIEDMVREERRTKGQHGGEGMRLAERIIKDSKFDNNLEYMDENAAKLARRVHKSEASLKNMAVSEFQKMSRTLDRCPLCHHEDTGRPPVAPVVSLGTRVFLTLPTLPEVSDGGALIVPLTHRTNLLECDDDEWEELRNFMKSLARLYHDQGRDVVFYENAGAPQRRGHAAMAAVPIPYAESATAPAFFREAFLTAGGEWAQHAKVIDTAARARDGGLGRMAFRRSLAKEMPYFHVWFSLDSGLAHVVDDPARWPRGDLFAREILAAIVGTEPHIVKKQGRWGAAADTARAEAWCRNWRKFDWTRALAEEGRGRAA